MTTLTSLATVAAVLLIGTIGVLLSQDPPTPEKFPPSTPTPDTTAPLAGTEITPLPITADPTAVAKLTRATHTTSDGIGPTWTDRFERTDRRGFTLAFWTSSEKTLSRPCPVKFGSDWQTTLDALAKEAGEVWRMRGSAAEFLSSELAAKLAASIDGRTARSGTRTQVLDWFAKQTGLTVTLHRSVSPDDGRLFRWSARTATTEAWLDGLAQTLKVAAFLAPDGTVTLYQSPTIIPLDNDPDLIAIDPHLVYQPPPPVRLDTEVALDFQDTDLVDVAKALQNALQYPIEIDPQVLTAGPPPVTLRVEQMKIRYVVGFVAKITSLEVQILPDRVRLTQEIVKPQPKPDSEPVIPSAAQ